MGSVHVDPEALLTDEGISSVLQEYIAAEMSSHPQGMPKGMLSTFAIRTFGATPAKTKALTMIREGCVEKWADELGMWTVDQNLILAV